MSKYDENMPTSERCRCGGYYYIMKEYLTEKYIIRCLNCADTQKPTFDNPRQAENFINQMNDNLATLSEGEVVISNNEANKLIKEGDVYINADQLIHNEKLRNLLGIQEKDLEKILKKISTIHIVRE